VHITAQQTIIKKGNHKVMKEVVNGKILLKIGHLFENLIVLIQQEGKRKRQMEE